MWRFEDWAMWRLGDLKIRRYKDMSYNFRAIEGDHEI
jgi:hypothetical protein